MLLDFISLADLTSDEVFALLQQADELKRIQREGKEYHPLKGQTLAMIFDKPSLRTRVTFETGIFQLGGHGVVMQSEKARLGERESVPDVARNLDRWVDGIMVRTFSHEAVRELADYGNGAGNQRANGQGASVPGIGRCASLARAPGRFGQPQSRVCGRRQQCVRVLVPLRRADIIECDAGVPSGLRTGR